MNSSKIWNEICDNAENDYYSLSSEERAIYNLNSLLISVNGAGLLSYYQGKAGGFAEDAIEDLYSIGMDEIAAVIENANAMFPEGVPPEDTEERLEIISDWNGEYDSLFDEWTDEILEFSVPFETELQKLFSEFC